MSISLEHRAESLFMRFIEDVTGGTFCLVVDPHKEFDIIFHKIEAKKVYPADQIRLIFVEQQLEYGRSLFDCDIANAG